MKQITDLLACFQAYLSSGNDDLVARFTTGFKWDMAERKLEPHILPVLEYLKDIALNAGTPQLLSALAAAAKVLHWGQTYGAGDFGEDFLQRYGWVELFGTRGHFASEDMAGGFLLLGPDIVYPDHHHVALEIYIPLTEGSLWSKDGGAFQPRAAGEIIHHPSDIRHAMQTRTEALVALYLWRGGPLAQKSRISGRDQ